MQCEGRLPILEIGTATQNVDGEWDLKGWTIDGRQLGWDYDLLTDLLSPGIGGWSPEELAEIAEQAGEED